MCTYIVTYSILSSLSTSRSSTVVLPVKSNTQVPFSSYFDTLPCAVTSAAYKHSHLILAYWPNSTIQHYSLRIPHQHLPYPIGLSASSNQVHVWSHSLLFSFSCAASSDHLSDYLSSQEVFETMQSTLVATILLYLSQS